MSDKKSNANGVYPQEAVKSDIVKNIVKACLRGEFAVRLISAW